MKLQLHHYLDILKFAWKKAVKAVKLRRLSFYTSLFISLTVVTYAVALNIITFLGDSLTKRYFENIFEIPYGTIYTHLERGSFIVWITLGFVLAVVISLLFLVHYFVKGYIGSLIIAASDDSYYGRDISISQLNPTARRYWGSMIIMDWIYLAVYFFLFSVEAISYIFISAYLPGFFSYISLVFFGIIFFCAVIVLSLTQVYARRYKIFYNLSLFQSILRAIQFLDRHFGAILLFGTLNAIVYWVSMLFYVIIALILPGISYYVVFRSAQFSISPQVDTAYGLIVLFAGLSLYVTLNAGSALLRNVYEVAATKFFHETETENHPFS